MENAPSHSMHFLDLPTEMIEYVASFLPAKSLSSLGQTCRLLRDITRIDGAWQVLCLQDYYVNSNKEWNLSYRDIYTKVLQRWGFLGLKRLALLPYGGLVHVCWAEGEIQVNGYHGQRTGNASAGVTSEPFFSLRWNESLNDMEAFCVQNPSGPKPAVLAQSGSYPLLQCAEKDCHKSHSRKDPRRGQTDGRFRRGFIDHPEAFNNFNLEQGFNCPMLPVEIPTPEDQARGIIQLGLYTGNYGSHGVEILNLMINRDNPLILEGLKLVGDPNVPAGNVSVTVYLDKPVVLSEAEQTSIYDIQEADEARSMESFEAVLNSNNNNPDLRQPFLIPPDCFDRGQHAPNTCLARYLGVGRIAGHFYTDPSYCKCHFIKFSDILFGVMWLELSSFSLFHKVKDEFPICITNSPSSS